MKIIGISGRKQSGKNTVANFINGFVLKSKNMTQDYYIDDDGSLVVKTQDTGGSSGFGVFDVTRKDENFIEYAERDLWPFIKVYHFADPLKDMAINLFNLNSEDVYGNDEQKNKKTDLLWENMANNFDNKQGRMTNREFLEHFGTNVIRKINHNVWSDYSIKKILKEQSELAIIPDVRFPNEVNAIKNAGGVVVRLTRNVFNSQAEPEKALDKDVFDWDNFDLVIDNSNISLQELCAHLNNNAWIWS